MYSHANMYLVKSIKLHIGALCMLGKEEWVEFIISVSKRHKLINHNINNYLTKMIVFSCVINCALNKAGHT